MRQDGHNTTTLAFTGGHNKLVTCTSAFSAATQVDTSLAQSSSSILAAAMDATASFTAEASAEIDTVVRAALSDPSLLSRFQSSGTT
mmetsp:Transcript_50732/g.127295  ORF Transcript_50732/g.127295 Transcript_50732/m.127295 type:complete len:87 (-) Transcript_50732:214-474(-)